jgi:hypothetical protein
VIEETFPVHELDRLGPQPTLNEGERVRSWRIHQLVQAGYCDEQAVALACAKVDLHVALDLRAHGCAAATALRILL